MATRARSRGLLPKVWGLLLSSEQGQGRSVRSFSRFAAQGDEFYRKTQALGFSECTGLQSGAFWRDRGILSQGHQQLSRLIHEARAGFALQAVELSKDFAGSTGSEVAEPAAGYTFKEDKLVGRRGTYNRSDSLSYLHARQRQVVKKLVNICMMDGKKATSRGIVYKALTNLAQHGDVVSILDRALENVKPICEVKKVRKAGTTQLVPCIIARTRQETLAMRWILEGAVKQRAAKKNLSLDQCLSAEILEASQKTGSARKKRDELHKLAEANRGSSHFRWW